MTRRTILVLAGILLVQSLVVASVFTPQPHSGGDNAGYVSLAHSLLDRGAYLEIWDPAEPPHTKYPPVFPALLALAILLGAKSWGALKLVPAFCTVLAVAFTFLWAQERRGPALGVVVALLTGISAAVVYYSQWVLSDPTFLAVTFAALWALRKSSGPVGGEGEDGVGKGGGGSENTRGSPRWLVAGLVLVVLAYFTRSAGLPLALASLIWLGFRKKWKAAAWFAMAFVSAAFLWWVRGSVLGGSQYVSEFWLLDPYEPHLGTVGPGALLGRLMENMMAYVTRIIPAGMVGGGFPGLPLLGIALALFSLVGWLRTLRKDPGVAELFLPLYFGLILLWPQAWSGDRFALPVFPLIYLYAGTALLWLMGSLPSRVRQVSLVLLVLGMAIPAGLHWRGLARAAGECRVFTVAGTPRRCLSPAQGEYLALAEWSGANLPDGAVVTTRKPRFFFLMSGVAAQSIPLVQGSDELMDRVREGGSRYISLDRLDGVSGYYLYPVLMERLASFCGLVEVGAAGQLGTQLLGLAEGDPGGGAAEPNAGALARCPEAMFRETPRVRDPVVGWEIPLLVWGQTGRE